MGYRDYTAMMTSLHVCWTYLMVRMIFAQDGPQSNENREKTVMAGIISLGKFACVTQRERERMDLTIDLFGLVRWILKQKFQVYGRCLAA